jgi:ParB-like chromosome segregation protein Spo0J
MSRSRKSSKRNNNKVEVTSLTNVVWVEREKITVHPKISRSPRSILDERKVIASIRKNGLLEEFPVKVIPDPRGDDNFIMFDGCSRLNGADERGYSLIPCAIYRLSSNEALNFAQKINGEPQEAIKKTPLAYYLADLLENSRKRNLSSGGKVLTVSEEEKKHLALMAGVSTTTIDHGLIVFRKLLRIFYEEDPSSSGSSVVDCFHVRIQEKPGSALARFFRDEISFHKFEKTCELDFPGLEKLGRKKRRDVDILQGSGSSLSDSVWTDCKQQVNGIGLKQDSFYEVDFDSQFASLLRSIESHFNANNGFSISVVGIQIVEFLEKFPDKRALLLLVSQTIVNLAKRGKWLSALPSPKGTVLTEDTFGQGKLSY